MHGNLLQRIIQETHARHDEPAYDDYMAVAFELFPAEMRAMGDSFARSGFIKALKDGMRRAANTGEDNPDAPEVQLDLLPGLAAPAYINIGNWVTPKLKSFELCTVEDLDVAIATRKTVYARQGARIEDLQMKREWLAGYARVPGDTVAAVVERMGGSPPRRHDDGLQPDLPM